MARIFGSPDRYIQQRGAIDDIGTYVEEFGSNTLLVCSPTARDLVGGRLKQSLTRAGIDSKVVEFHRECSPAEIDRLTDHASNIEADFIIGAGGGKTLDTTKAVGAQAAVDSVIVPTIASTDAPCSAESVVYTDDGEFEEYRFHNRHPAVVLVDTAVVAKAPTDLFIAGIGDALATWFEADVTYQAHADNNFGKDTLAGHRIAKLCYETVRSHARSAIDSVRNDVVSPSVKAVVEANVLLSGIGFESGGLAATHAVHNGLTQLDAVHNATHGEKVNIGTLTLLVLEGYDDSVIEDIVDFSLDVGLPVTLAGIGLEDPSDDQIRTVAEAACAEEETIHNHAFEVKPAMVHDAIVTANQIGQRATSSDRNM